MSAPDVGVPLGPFDTRPSFEIPGLSSIEAAREVWRTALRGLPVGAYDLRMVEWAESVMDQPMLIAFASLLERARHAGGDR